jgi:hypothetical protein
MLNRVYLVSAIVGALIPILFFLGVFHGEAVCVAAFLPAIFVNSATGGFAADLVISSFVFWVFMFTRDRGPKPWLFIAVNLFIGLSCALPAYLYVLESARDRPAAIHPQNS